jgi:hypothetical protein
MSSNIWTPDALLSSRIALTRECWRVVEAQHRISTMKLVDTLEEQAVLESILDESKPPIPQECRHLDYLLFTPFRYAAYPQGSRFRRAGMTPGVFYAAFDVETALAELAFHRLLFFAESPATQFPKNPAEYTTFSVRIQTIAALDLREAPLAADAAAWMQLQDYTPCQALADAARAAAIEAIVYASVRHPAHRACVAVLRCCAFANPKPIKLQSWRILMSRHGAFASCEAPARGMTFPIGIFLTDTRLQPLTTQAN